MNREKRRKRNEQRAEVALNEMNDDAASTMVDMLERAAVDHPEEVDVVVSIDKVLDEKESDRECGTAGKGRN